MSQLPTKSLYVVKLRSAIYEEKQAFRDENPGYRYRRPCIYVGSTAKTPEERYEQHKAGVRAGRKYVTHYGQRLMPRLYRRWKRVPAVEAEAEERALAERLRARGYAVWQR